MDNNEFKRIFGEEAKINDFEFLFGGWFKESHETIVVLDLQKSNYGNYYELNIKIYVQGMLGNKYIMSKDLVKNDTGDIFRRHPREFKDAISLDKQMDTLTRKELLRKLFVEFIVPFSKRAASKSGIRELAEDGQIYLLHIIKKSIYKTNSSG